MKSYLAALLVLTCVVIAVIASADKNPSKDLRRIVKCKNDTDCSKKECCVKTASPFMGRCKPLGKLRSPCLPKDVVNANHQPKCPCQSGMECKPKSKVMTEVGEIPRNLRCVIKTEDENGGDQEEKDEDNKNNTMIIF